MQVTVHYRDDVFHASIDAAERADQLLLRCLHHFDVDPLAKSHDAGWWLRPRGAPHGTERIVLDHPIGEQVDDGADLVLEQDVAGSRRPSTGLY